MKISIITPIHNDSRTLPACLKALSALKVPPGFEIENVLVDDGSTDDSPRIAAEFAFARPDAILVQKMQGGEASALNAGLDKATGDMIAIIEADVEPHDDWLLQVLAEMKDERVAGVGGFMETPADDPWLARLTGYEAELRQPSKRTEVRHITSANAIYRRAAFDQFGRFDERMINSCLDMDFNLRLVAAGRKLIFTPEARVKHHFKPGIMAFLKRQYAYGRYRPMLSDKFANPADWRFSLQLALAVLFVISLLFSGWSAGPAVAIAIAFYLTQFRDVARLISLKGDLAALALPLVTMMRSLAGLAGLAVGYLSKPLQ